MGKIAKLELIKSEYNYVSKLLKEQIEELKSMTREQRIEWYNNSLFNKPINFTKQIDNTVYTVNTHFNESASESIEDKMFRIIK